MLSWLRVLGKYSSFIILVSLVTACDRNSQDSFDNPNSSPTSSPPPNSPIQVFFDSTVPSDQKAIIEDDIRALYQLSIPNPQPKTSDRNSNYTDAALMSLNNFSMTEITRWLTDRMKVIVGEDFDLEVKSVPPIVKEKENDKKLTTIMINLGSSLYRRGKSEGSLYKLMFSAGLSAIKSPRAGIFQIGAGYFSVNRIEGSPINSLANRIVRLGTLFHEARHDDSNGKTVGFPHSLCPASKGENFVNEYACESNLNGPYSVEAIILDRLFYACTSCTASEKTGIQAFVSDSKYRLIGTKVPDARPESIQ